MLTQSDYIKSISINEQLKYNIDYNKDLLFNIVYNALIERILSLQYYDDLTQSQKDKLNNLIK